jgi:fibronectin-binding autotransporter adhesin
MLVRLADERVEAQAGGERNRAGLHLFPRRTSPHNRGKRHDLNTRSGQPRAMFALAVGAGMVSCCAPFARATSDTWANTGTNWTTGADWTNTAGYPGSTAATNDIAYFNAPAVTQPNLTAALSIAAIDFTGASGYDITSSAPADTLTLSGATPVNGTNTTGINTVAAPLIFNTAAQTIEQASGGTLVLSGSLSATGTLSDLYFNGSNSSTEVSSNFIEVSGTSNSLNVPIQIGYIGAGAVVAVTALGTTSSDGSLGQGNITLGFTGGGNQYCGLDYRGAGETSNKIFTLYTTTGVSPTRGIDTTGASGALILTSNIVATDASASTVQTLQLTSADTYGDTISGVIPDGTDGKVAVEKLGVGQWILSATNTYSGDTQSAEGTLTLDFVNQTTSTSVLKSGGMLTLGQTLVATSDTLSLKGAAGIANTQTMGAIVNDTGASHIVLTSGAGGTISLTTGAFSTGNGGNAIGGTLDVSLIGNATVTLGTASTAISSTSSGLFQSAITLNGTDFATNAGSAATPIYALPEADYITATTAITTNQSKPLDVMGNVPITGTVVGLPAVRFNQGAADTITISPAKTLTVGEAGGNSNQTAAAILVTANVGANLSLITGGSLYADWSTGGRTLNLIQNNTAGALEIDSAIINNGGSAESLSKSGQGLAVLTGIDTYTGSTYLNEGTLSVDNTNNSSAILSGTSTISIAGGATLQLVSSTAGPGGVVNLVNDNAVLAVSSGAKVVLNLQGSTENVLQFVVNGIYQPAGVYSQTTAPAGYAIDEGYFTSTSSGDSITVAVPEPGAIALMLGAGAIGFLKRRLRRGTRRVEC